MKNKFVDWYRVVNMEPTAEQIEARWNAINSFVEEYDNDTILKLAVNYLALKPDIELKDKFVECLRDTDVTFNKNFEKEITLLTGISLAILLEEEPVLSELAVKCLTLFVKFPISQELGDYFEGRFTKNCLDIRENLTKLDDLSLTNQSKIIKTNFSEESSWEDNSIIPLGEILTSFNNNFIKFQNAHNKLVENIDIYAEDSRILSWIVGESSNDLKKAFKAMKQEEAALIVGKELADLITVYPGPYAAEAFIKKMLGLSRKGQKGNVTLNFYIDSLKLDWKELLLERYPLVGGGMNTPVLLAISMSLEVDNPGEWLPMYKKRTGIDSESFCVSPEKLAYQIYLECLLIKSINR